MLFRLRLPLLDASPPYAFAWHAREKTSSKPASRGVLVEKKERKFAFSSRQRRRGEAEEVERGAGSSLGERTERAMKYDSAILQRQPPPYVSGGVGSHLMRIQWSTVVAGASCASLFCVAPRRAASRRSGQLGSFFASASSRQEKNLTRE